jgi:plastocyanin
VTRAHRRPGRLVRSAALFAAAVSIALGCSSGASSPAAPVATTTVDLPKSYKFVPESIAVDVGARVTWTNSDNFTHNVTVEDEPPKPVKPGESTSRQFTTAGSFPYQCTLHPQDMQGTVIVGG